MTRRIGIAAALVVGFLVAIAPLAAMAQEGSSEPAASVQAADMEHAAPVQGAEEGHEAGAEEAHGSGDYIMEHVQNGTYLDLPGFNSSWHVKVPLPQFAPIHIAGMEIDLSPTRHLVMLMLAAVITAVVLISAARSSARSQKAGRAPRGMANAIEAMVLYLRSDVILPNVGPNGEKFVPYLLTAFFLILFANLIGLVPYGATATSNIGVTAGLAVVAFFVVEISGMIKLGRGYIGTMVFWPHEMSLGMKLPLTLILTPIEIISKIVKPFTLAIRLFANMIAGHIVILAIIGMIFVFGSWFIAPFPAIMALAISLLEILICFIQALVFTLLVSVYIGQVRVEHH